jgi:hypothetical protein
MKTRSILLLLCFAVIGVLVGCGPDSKEPPVRSGEAVVYVDEEVVPLLQPMPALAHQQLPDATLTLLSCKTDTAVYSMLRGTMSSLVLPRDFTQTEQQDITNSALDITTSIIAQDALVLYTRKDFPSDTVVLAHVSGLYAGTTFPTEGYAPRNISPFLVLPGSQSSITYNAFAMLGNQKPPQSTFVHMVSNSEEALSKVQKTPGAIGVGYLSQFVGNTSVKLLRIGYDSAGVYKSASKPVHASYVIMGQYPLPVPIRYLLRDRITTYSPHAGFMQFVSKDPSAQRVFLEKGIQPWHAKIELIPQD